jgi:hypothetical protein
MSMGGSDLGIQMEAGRRPRFPAGGAPIIDVRPAATTYTFAATERQEMEKEKQ